MSKNVMALFNYKIRKELKAYYTSK